EREGADAGERAARPAALASLALDPDQEPAAERNGKAKQDRHRAVSTPGRCPGELFGASRSSGRVPRRRAARSRRSWEELATGTDVTRSGRSRRDPIPS